MTAIDCQMQVQPDCSAVISPADAGRGVFDGLSNVSAVQAVVGAGALLASLFFAVLLARLVASMFRAHRELREWRASHPSGRRAAAMHRAAANDLDSPDDEELDREDDSETDEDDHQEDSPGAPEKHQ